jgi:cyanoexosortase B-associated protein
MRLPKLLHLPVSQVVLLCFLIVLIAIGAVPSYLSGNWAWVNPPQVTNFKQLKSLRQNGLALPDGKLNNSRSKPLAAINGLFRNSNGMKRVR